MDTTNTELNAIAAGDQRVEAAPGKLNCDVSVAKFTVAVTPPSLPGFFPTLTAHEAQLIPPIESFTVRVAGYAAAAVWPLVTPSAPAGSPVTARTQCSQVMPVT